MSDSSPAPVVQPYLFFDGRCEEALEYYRKNLGATIDALMRFRESPEPSQCGPIPGDKVMHACFRLGDSTIMASDGQCAGAPSFQGFALSLTAANPAEAERRFAVLADGGQVLMPLGKTFYSPCFGMVTDRFGVMWMIIVLA